MAKKRVKISDDLYTDHDRATINAICPAQHIEAVRDIAIEYINDTKPGHPDTRNGMLPIKLSPTGQEPATHYLCSITTNAEEADAMADRLLRERGRGKNFCHNAKLNKNANKNTINNVFVIVVCDKQELLDKMGLQEIN